MNDRAYNLCVCILVALVVLIAVDKAVEIREKQAMDAKADRVLTLLESFK